MHVKYTYICMYVYMHKALIWIAPAAVVKRLRTLTIKCCMHVCLVLCHTCIHIYKTITSRCQRRAYICNTEHTANFTTNVWSLSPAVIASKTFNL